MKQTSEVESTVRFVKRRYRSIVHLPNSLNSHESPRATSRLWIFDDEALGVIKLIWRLLIVKVDSIRARNVVLLARNIRQGVSGMMSVDFSHKRSHKYRGSVRC